MRLQREKFTMVTVEQWHIDNGKMSNNMKCPIALAVRDVACDYVDVSPYSIQIGEEEFNLPMQIQHIIDTYDDRGEMYPFSFMLEGKDEDLQ